jgi:hypothetical protein
MTNSMLPILMVGSIPLDSAEQVFRACSEYIGPYASCFPDGEFGPRTSWVGYLAKEVYNGHPDLVTVQRLDVSKPTSIKDSSNKWIFRVRPGVQPRIETGYAQIAIDSYGVFSRLQRMGVIPEHVRFQVCFPARDSAFMAFFEELSDWPIMAAAHEDAFRRDIQAITARIPAAKLAIQLDICQEVRDIQNNFPWSPPGPRKFEKAVASAASLAAMVPEEALLGLHWCYGTLGGWPMVRIEDLDLCTRLTNEAVQRIKRQVNYVHVPVLRHVDDSYFLPARNLEAPDTKVYLGLIHHTDGMEGFEARVAMARRHVRSDFGVASVCGYGRLPPGETRVALELHRAAGAHMDEHGPGSS